MTSSKTVLDMAFLKIGVHAQLQAVVDARQRAEAVAQSEDPEDRCSWPEKPRTSRHSQLPATGRRNKAQVSGSPVRRLTQRSLMRCYPTTQPNNNVVPLARPHWWSLVTGWLAGAIAPASNAGSKT
ncbi:hypothetical protein SVAN01_04501 [Stagonosporopsis vannaccii]|nr:hypothetical protein SVAN01_04501 [Stagonosporopsis vannaccii]